MTTIQQTITVPADRRLRFDMPLPETVRSPRVDVVIVISDEPAAAGAEDADDEENGLAATLAACQEARDIMSGKIKSKAYHSAREMIDEIEAEIAAEEEAERACAVC